MISVHHLLLIIFTVIAVYAVGFCGGAHTILHNMDKIDGNLVVDQETTDLYLQVASTAYDDFKKKQTVTFKIVRK